MSEGWWVYLGVGAFVGFCSGLLGPAGGSAMVPLRVSIFAAERIAPAAAAPLALGTAIAAILFTSAAAVRTHQLRRAVDWDVVAPTAPGTTAGTFDGARLAHRLSGPALKRSLALVLYALAPHRLLRPA